MASAQEFRFQQAVQHIQSTGASAKSMSNEQKLVFYSLYKQTTEGDAKGDRPGFMSFVARAKWDAWNSVRGKSQEESMARYIAEYEKELGSGVSTCDTSSTSTGGSAGMRCGC
ncbi:unnamed protein product [Polarella glacialis]|uniref:ACB domain-containing protein n=1 Tax=Polarella glacialis TaxID=89957 RepID=A0A813E7P0_POLGL|nr:unnamed protein product [Polarella glacialis]